jgi:hypothetical protein
MKKFLQLLIFLPSFAMAQYTGMIFDGTGDYIVTSYNGVSGSGSRTVQCWYRGFSSTNQRFMVDMGATSGGNGARFSVKINPSASVARIEIGGGGLDGVTNINNNFWHQITIVYNNAAATNKYKIYVDGVLDAQGDIAFTLNTAATSANPTTIGIRTDLSSTTTMAGSLDDVRIWSVPLTAAEISANYNKELCGTPLGLAAYFKMNEGTASGNNTSVTSLVNQVTPASSNPLFGFTLTGNGSNYTSHVLALPNNSTTQTVSSCSNYTWAQTGQTYGASGMYYDTVNLYAGCDSVYILNLSVSLISGSTVSVSNCTNYTWPANGQTYGVTGQYTDTLTTTAGCDSIVTLNLTITPLAPVTITASNCMSYLWPQTGITYTASGLYADTLQTVGGCDSIVKLNLTIKMPSSAIVNVNTCTSYLWLMNNATYTSSGTYFDTIPNSVGCDSVVQLNLTLNPALPITAVTFNACSASYVWPQNSQTYTTAGVYYDTMTSVGGCDSIIKLTLTLFNVSNNVTNNGNGTLSTNATGVTYQWIKCPDNTPVVGATSQIFAPSVIGNYAVIVSNSSCSDTSSCTTINSLGIEELVNNNFTVYPNPTAGLVNIKAIGTHFIQGIEIQDAQGKRIYSQETNQSSASISLADLDNGIYFITIHGSENQRMNYRIVKQ